MNKVERQPIYRTVAAAKVGSRILFVCRPPQPDTGCRRCDAPDIAQIEEIAIITEGDTKQPISISHRQHSIAERGLIRQLARIIRSPP